jgi:alkylhydroperoxidase family enzyme
VPAAYPALFDLLGLMADVTGITFRERAVLITACASSMSDPYCALAWGRRLADETSPELAAMVVAGGDTGLDPREAAIARWARRVATDANGTTADHVDELRRVGLTDTQIFALTLFVAGRIAFSTVNDALGADPDAEMLATTPAVLREAVTFGRQHASAV